MAHLDQPVFDRNVTLAEYIPLVQSVARQVARRYPSSLDVDDLTSAGTIGMMNALERYRPERGVPLRAFLLYRIRGAMVDAVRSADWVPREVRRRARRLAEVRSTLSSRLMRPPTHAELATAMGQSEGELDDYVAGSVGPTVIPLDAPIHADSDLLWEEVVPGGADSSAEEAWITLEERESVAQAFACLSPDEQTVVSLYYEGELRYREIGAQMGVGESRVSQLRTSAVERLRRRIHTQEGNRRRIRCRA